MKMQYILICLISLAALSSCDYESYEEESALTGLAPTDPFVRLITGGAGGTEEAVVSPTDTTFEVEIESQLVIPADVTVDYTLGGTATYGEVYEIPGATASGGSVTIPWGDLNGVTTFPSEAVTINFLVDTLLNGPETIIIDLVSASTTDGAAVLPGQGPLRNSLTLTLEND
jgi:hypothetical protein